MSVLFFLSLLGCFSLVTCAHKPAFNAPITGESAEFIPHLDEKPMKAYLALNLPYGFYKDLLAKTERSETLSLKNRGEAHITLITPVEYDKILKKHLSIAEIHRIALQANIQQLPFKLLCIGRGQREIDNKLEKTYYAVVEGPALIELRRQIEAAYIQQGGKAQEFIPENFHPHVTLGYTLRDLHFEEGVVKNKSSCVYPIEGF